VSRRRLISVPAVGTRTVVIRAGSADEGARLKEIAIASKGHWGYAPERVREWAERGDFGRETLEQLALFVADTGERAVAWASVESRGDVAWLADLWVEPEWMGKGLGTRLFRRAAEHARRSGARVLEWEAEPNALGFYEKMGGRYVRDSTSEWGRTLSVMGVDLA
jgi:GNAT superfamily N-acetyltransferase